MRFSPNVASLQPSATLALAARAKRMAAQGISIVDLSAGEPAYGTPPYAAAAGVRAIQEGRTGYPPTQGIPKLRRAVLDYLGATTAHPDPGADERHVLVSAGVKQALHNCLFCLVGAGDEVLIPAPYWPSYPALVRLARAEPVVVPTEWSEGFLVDPDRLERHRTGRTRALLLNSPSNPTGAVYDGARLEEILDWCAAHGIWVLSDEIYRRLHYDRGPAPSVWDLAGRPERVVLLDGVSKAFCMTGWRIGWAVGPPELIARATDYQSQTTSGAVTPSQYAAARALADERSRERSIEELLAKLRRNRRVGLERLGDVEALDTRPPDGAIYFYVRLREPGSSAEVAERLLTEAGVAAIPGEPFGSPGHLRFSFAVEEATLAEGLERIRAFFGDSARPQDERPPGG